MVEIKGKISKIGNSYHFRIPKALVDCKVFSEGQEIALRAYDAESNTLNVKEFKLTTRGGDSMKCPTCDGYGEYEVTEFADTPQLTAIEACMACKGTGHLDE